MWSSAVRYTVLAGITTLACWSGSAKPKDTPLVNRGTALEQDDAKTTPYWCSIRDGDFDYPEMPCAVRRIDGKLVLAKLAGSQRFRGVIQPRSGGGFSFDGQFYCPWGDCTKRLVGEFRPAGRDGALQGTFDGDSMIVTLVPAPANSAWGGASYGGDGYGGFGYGGYGGYGYGGYSYGGMRRRRH